MRLIYLAGPYKSQDKKIMAERVNEYATAVAYYMNQAKNLYLFSPILQCRHVALLHGLPHDFDFWAQRDFFMIKKSAAMWVLTIPGWQESYGLSQELEYADSIDREVMYLLPDYGQYVLTDARPVYTPTPII